MGLFGNTTMWDRARGQFKARRRGEGWIAGHRYAKEYAAKREEREFFTNADGELALVADRANSQYAAGIRMEYGTFQGCRARLEYGQTGNSSRIDIYYADCDNADPKTHEPHGHIVIKNGVADYIKRPEDKRPIVDGRSTSQSPRWRQK